MWLDQYTAKIRIVEAGNSAKVVEDVTGHFSKMEYEWRLAELEKRVASLEQRKKN
ncbi:hypothetical protein PIB30_113245, partial [Stylosanthes scabra]|nr:hypothetical protein [Stylosanthes scabra]